MKAIEEIARLATKIADGSMSPDEPLFVLRGQDVIAPLVVREWAKIAEQHGTPHAKLKEAIVLSSRMDEWQPRQIPGRPCTLGTVIAASRYGFWSRETGDAGEKQGDEQQ